MRTSEANGLGKQMHYYSKLNLRHTFLFANVYLSAAPRLEENIRQKCKPI